MYSGIVINIQCTFARLHTYNLTKTDQSQVRVQKRGVGYTFSRRYVLFSLGLRKNVIFQHLFFHWLGSELNEIKTR
jgi:hypothetical protein